MTFIATSLSIMFGMKGQIEVVKNEHLLLLGTPLYGMLCVIARGYLQVLCSTRAKG